MPQVTGTAVIRVDGRELRSLQGATLNIGGFKLDPKKGGGKVHGFSEEVMEATMDCKIAHTKDLSVKGLGAIRNATVLFDTDTGVQFVLRNCNTIEPPSLDSGSGEVDLKMAAEDCDEVT